MKVLVRSLLLGLVCDAQEADDEKGLSQLSGKWRTVYIASTSPEKIAEDGPFRAYLCYLVFDDEQGTVDFYFYVKAGGMGGWGAVPLRASREYSGSLSRVRLFATPWTELSRPEYWNIQSLWLYRNHPEFNHKSSFYSKHWKCC
ncbi:hypothetical protein FD754_012520 [Muntiacus muntjak]|uniref:Lipocalin/cytosolic fatty-acid binding domain-containing protein n=1 Tax=Muntiacus muntjak TaxID=9888 RepID=A0A5N3VF96_MUNMU|nr:hypothetical protein FD754_012520 [Muntiacus muntjak]